MTEKDKRQGGRPFKPGAGKASPGGKKTFGPRKGGKPTARDRKPGPPPKAHAGERIAKAMARAGACSRRDAEEWIAAGRVAVNGRTLESPAFNVTAADKITIDGRPLAAREHTRLFLFHKPRGLVTTDRDPEGRQTIFDFLGEQRPDLPRLMSVGRLDINTEGLLLLTNDGGLARTLELPQTGWLRRYRVRAHGETDQAALDALARGVTVDDVEYAPIEAKLDRVQGANAWITLGLREGKNREVRRVLGSLGLEVNRLIRVSYGPFQLGDLAEGAVEEVRTRVLRDQLGPSLIAQSQADFDTPAREESERRPRARNDERPPRRERGSERDERRPRREFAPREDRFAPPDEQKKAERPKPGSRKHVGTLRAEREQRMKEERVRIERRETADRKGRAVVVERVVSTEPKTELENRNARRFKAERDGDRPMRRKTRDGAPQERRFSRGGDAEPSDRRRERPQFEKREGGRAFASRENADERKFVKRGGERKFETRDKAGERSFKPREKFDPGARKGPAREGAARKGPRRDSAAPRGARPDGGKRPPRGKK